MDIGRALTFFTEDERWVEKTAIGTGLLLISLLFSVLMFGVIGFFILFGYLVRLMQNVRDDVHPALPEWNQWGDDLVRGLKLACVYLVWAFPIILVSGPLFIIGAIVGESDDIGTLFMLCSFCLGILFGIAYAVLQPGFTIAFARNEAISDGLQISEIWDWTRRNIGNVVIVAILTAIASLLITAVGSIVGVILCVIGVVVTVPLSQLIFYYFQSHLYGQLARSAGSGAGAFAARPQAPPADEPAMEEGTPVEPTPSAGLVPPVVLDPATESKPPAEPEPPVALAPATESEQLAEPEPSVALAPATESKPPAEPEPPVVFDPATESEQPTEPEPPVVLDPAATESEPPAKNKPPAESKNQ